MSDEFLDLLRKHISQRGGLARLARASGIKSPVIGHWAKGETRPSPENLKRIAGPLGVSHANLMKMCGHLEGDADPQGPDPEIQARIAQIASYASTFKSEYRPIFWDNITTQASTLAVSLQQIGSTAVSTHGHDAISGGGAGSEERREDRRGSRKRALAASLPTLRHQLASGLRSMSNVPVALSALLGASPSRQLAA